jgi:predicted nucleotide-binding protein (sugar kinase/HSP70/actin superfamily)
MFYYKYIEFWKAFFTELGAEIIVSELTNKRILNDGVKVCVDEACLPVKLFFGHVINIMDRVDYILVPRFTSISKGEYVCPEFGGLPDMVRHTIKGLPKLIDTEVNLRKSKKGGVKAAVQMAAIIGASRRDALAAYRKAQARLALALGDGSLKGDGSFKGDGSLRGDGSLSGLEKTSRIRVREPSLPQMSEQSVPSARSGRTVPPVWVAVVGHPYTVYDRYISMDLLGKLEKRGIGVKTIEMVCHGDINRTADELAKPMFWYYGRTAYGAAMHLARSGEVDGIICLTSFGCGIDSFVNDLIERKIKRESDIPFITMTIDEHSGEAGFNTRLEAFTDMLHWRRCNEDNIPTPGEHIYSCQINT